MPYVTSIERLAREEGRLEGLAEARAEARKLGYAEGALMALCECLEVYLVHRFGDDGRDFFARLAGLEFERLWRLQMLIIAGASLDDLRRQLPAQ